MVLEKKIFKCFPIIRLWQIVTPLGRGQFGPQGRLARFIKGLTKHCFTQNIKALGLMVSEKKIFLKVFSYYKSMEANDPRGVANLDPRGMICGINEGYH